MKTYKLNPEVETYNMLLNIDDGWENLLQTYFTVFPAKVQAILQAEETKKLLENFDGLVLVYLLSKMYEENREHFDELVHEAAIQEALFEWKSNMYTIFDPFNGRMTR